MCVKSGGTRQIKRAARRMSKVRHREYAGKDRAKVDLARLGPRKSEPAKVLLAAALRAEAAVSNGWLCARLGMGTPASVSQFVRRWLADAANAESMARLRATVSNVKT